MRAVKIISFLLALIIIFVGHSYLFGSMYGGKKYQRTTVEVFATSSLEKYARDQATFFEANKEFSQVLHRSPEFASPIMHKEFKAEVTLSIGFRDRPEIEKICPDCTLTKSTYKIGALSTLESVLGTERFFWTVNETGKVVFQPIQ